MSDRILPSWRDGQTRTEILDFLDRVEEIPPNERVAVFDNDGTMWAEKPNYPQVDFLLLELHRATEADPGLADKPEFAAILTQDTEALEKFGLERTLLSLLDLFEGITPEAFNAKVASFFANAVHPDRAVSYRQTRYQPMIELMHELRSRGFDFYIVSAGGAEFVRVIGEDFYGVRPEGVVGSQIDYDLVRGEDDGVTLVRTNRVVGSGLNEGSSKPPNIQRLLGRRPVVAGGNSPGDAEMLEYAMSYDGPSLSILVHHDDAEREYEYESVAGTFEVEESITDQAKRLGWTVASIRNDWSTVFTES